jgi:hypothetical protein
VKKFVLFVSAWILTSQLLAQNNKADSLQYQSHDKKEAKKKRINNMVRMEEEGELIFNKQSAFGIKLATDGYGLSYEKGKFKTNTRTLLFQFEFNEKKESKDHKVAAAGYNGYNFNSVVVGKLNNFYELKLAIGQQHLIGGKGNKNGVAVTALYTGGFSLAVLKPYNVEIQDQKGNQFRSTYPTIIDSGYIELGASGFFAGWDQVSVKPGVNAKTALRFDYGRFNQTLTAIEAGVTFEYYFSKIPMLYQVPQKNFFFNAYITIMFGRRK